MVTTVTTEQARAMLSRWLRDESFADQVVVEDEGKPRLAIIPAGAYERFRQWERCERVRQHIFSEMARRLAKPDWDGAFDVLDGLSRRAALSDDELQALLDRAVEDT